MSDNIVFKSPKLMFPDESGNYVAEYIPSEPTYFENKIDSYLLDRRIKKLKDIYYWHIKHLISPDKQKIIDINFILHIANNPDHFKPIDGEEYDYYNDILHKYAKELYPFINYEGINAKKINTIKSLMQKEPYYVAYKKRWIDTFNYGADFKLLYHGIDAIKALALLKTVLESSNEKEKKMARSLGLSLKEFCDILDEQTEALNQEKVQETDPNYISTKEGLIIFYWVTDIFLTLGIIFIMVESWSYGSVVSNIANVTVSIATLQIFFFIPYLIVKSIKKVYSLKTAKKDSSKKPEPEEEL